jgi:hypothetical protein
MAQIEIGDAMPSYGWFDDFYDMGSLKLKTKSANKAVFEDNSGASIVLTGTGFDYKGSQVTGGNVKSVEFLDSDDGTLISVSGGKFNAAKLTDQLEKHDGLGDFVSFLTSGNDKIIGTDVGDSLNLGSNEGNDTIIAGTGGSFMEGSQGNDTMKGGVGYDTLSYDYTFDDGAAKGIKLDASKGTVIDSWGDKDKISSIDEYRGSAFKDEMIGGQGNEIFGGLKGDDVIDGGKGDDEVRYVNDFQQGGKKGIVADLSKGTVTDGFGDKDHVSNIENVTGTMKDDKFTGDDNDNYFRGLDGKDSYDGGGGTDSVNLQYWQDGVGQHGAIVDLSKSKGQIVDDGFGNTETTKSIEAVSGSQFDDQIKLGNNGGWVWADAGDDRLIDSKGAEWFAGADGADTFVFESVKTMESKGDLDYIDDFAQGEDKIDLSGIKGLSFAGEGKFGGAQGELRFEIDDGQTYVSGDTDGDKKADFSIALNHEIQLQGSDFTL